MKTKPIEPIEVKVFYDYTITTTDGNVITIRAYNYYTTEPWSVFVTDDEWTNVQTALVKYIHCKKSSVQ